MKYPSIGPGPGGAGRAGAIVFQYAEELCLLDLAAGAGAAPRRLGIRVPTDEVAMRPWYVDAGEDHGSFGLSPGGARLLLEARGEILSVPVEKAQGEPVNLTAASGSREKNAAWSPDGRRVAFLSDRSGEEEVYLVDAAGGESKQLTRGGRGFRTQLVWSPDGKWLLFADKYLRLNLVDAASGALEVVVRGDTDDGWERWGIQDYVWSPDSKWIAYTRMNENLNETIHLYSLACGKSYPVTDDRFTSGARRFDPQGRYL